MKNIPMTTTREYTGLSTCGCTAFASIGRSARRRDRKLGWLVLLSAFGPCHPNGVEILGIADGFATEADAVASIESGWPEVVWVAA